MKIIKLVSDKLKVSYKALGFVFSLRKSYVFLTFTAELINSLKVLPYMYLLKIAVNLLNQKADFLRFAIEIMVMLLIILFLELSVAIINKFKSEIKIKLDFDIKDSIIDKTDYIDYYTLSTKEYFMLKEKAMEGYNRGCIEKNISLVFSIVSNIILLIGIIVTISDIGLALFIPILLTIIVRIISESFDRSANYIRTTKMSEINRKSGYLHKICENIIFAKEIRIFNLENKFDEKLSSVSKEKNAIWKKYMRRHRYSSATHIIANIMLQLAMYLILAYRVLATKTMSVSDFVYIFAACQQIQNIIGNLALNNIDVFLNSVYLKDFINYWEYDGELINSKKGFVKSEIDINNMCIEFENVSFRYPNSEFDALSNISVKLKTGGNYLIVGKNGAGKSTFIKLLCRLYKPTSGKIYLNGTDIQEYDIKKYYSILSVLFQDYKTLKLKIRDNISSMNSEEDDNNTLFRVSKESGIYDKITKLPCAFETMYSKDFDANGTEFSGGEAQKMMIAKALYKNAPFMIFDEPTSGLDAISDENVYNHLHNISNGKILIYITHRLSTGINCDNILVFSEGKIQERGTHKELMNLNGIYSHLFSSQAKLYAEDQSV